MLMHRLIFGALLIIGLVAIFWGDAQLASAPQPEDSVPFLRCGSIIPVVVTLLALFGTFEIFNLVRSAGYDPMVRTCVVGILLLNTSAWFIPAVTNDPQAGVFHGQMIILVLCAMIISIVQIARLRTERAIGDIAVSVLILVYTGILPSFIIVLRASLPGHSGVWAVLMFVTVVKCADIGAYFTGLAIGKTKLIPRISPGKTIEGLAGGLITAMVVAILLGRLLPWSRPDGTEVELAVLQAVVFGGLVAGIGQLGDLVESAFKRDAASKDSANIIPAFGGILDLLDSAVFAAPIGYLLLHAWLG